MKKLYFTIVALGLCLIFQNCSKVAFGPSLESKESIADHPDEFGNIGGNTGFTEENGNNGIEESNGADDSNGSNGNTGNNEEPYGAVAECDKLRNQRLIDLVDGSSITNVSGAMRFRARRIVAIKNNAGSLRVLGVGDDATIDLIQNTSGSILACNIDISTIGTTSGNITLVGGTIGNITGQHAGSISIYNGNIGSIKESSGSVHVTNGNIGSVTNMSGAIRIESGTITGSVTNHSGAIIIAP